ncbi:hypothetical protein PVL30_001262 [Lodderomyces elongisporus]|uniref:uncharacterized protein n=1 Tax=Lodderomyces elongisporus TaxID=36914 RepID=UPI00291C7D52|nr:uncharacterized protein PVL30_001262 [Lodderomyces elongisporus]WLF77544.1 hypothetical protein PVL30_001262 [Lodderomyces elongisporus]
MASLAANVGEHLLEGITIYPYLYVNVIISSMLLIYNLRDFKLFVLSVWNISITLLVSVPLPDFQIALIAITSTILSYFSLKPPNPTNYNTINDSNNDNNNNYSNNTNDFFDEKSQNKRSDFLELTMRLLQYYQLSLVLISAGLLSLAKQTIVNIEQLGMNKSTPLTLLTSVIINHDLSMENIQQSLAMVEIISINCWSVLNLFAYVMIPLVLTYIYNRRGQNDCAV